MIATVVLKTTCNWNAMVYAQSNIFRLKENKIAENIFNEDKRYDERIWNQLMLKKYIQSLLTGKWYQVDTAIPYKHLFFLTNKQELCKIVPHFYSTIFLCGFIKFVIICHTSFYILAYNGTSTWHYVYNCYKYQRMRCCSSRSDRDHLTGSMTGVFTPFMHIKVGAKRKSLR